MLVMLASADEIRDLRKTKASEEVADYVSQGMTRLQQLDHNPPRMQYAAKTMDKNTVKEAHAANTSDSDSLPPST